MDMDESQTNLSFWEIKKPRSQNVGKNPSVGDTEQNYFTSIYYSQQNLPQI